jgi:dihydroorotate dehydrogenase electron transfer subunit
MSVEEMRDDGVEVIAVTDIEGTSDVGNVSVLLEHLRREGRMDALYTCGSNRLLQLARAVAHKFDIFGEVALEQQMACGLGMCFSCVRPFREGRSIVHRRVCCEGPVFPLQNAISW